MTAQFLDIVNFESEDFMIIGCNSKLPFIPQDHGITPVNMGTACYRGHVCFYLIENNILMLDKLWISSNDIYPKINGVQHKSNKTMHCKEYKEIHLLLDYSGKILIGKDFASQRRRNMGFPKIFDLKFVKEIEFNQGNAIKLTDLTDKIEQKREELEKEFQNQKTSETWVERCFSLEYDLDML